MGLEVLRGDVGQQSFDNLGEATASLREQRCAHRAVLQCGRSVVAVAPRLQADQHPRSRTCSCTAAELFSPHLAVRPTTCVTMLDASSSRPLALVSP